MGSSESGEVADGSVGSIVWVRRRNGSWWPGKILDQEELSLSHITSPRSGTPVKLLGREDASVDWYNLEKSKRVKAFRCGEFDDCIERAEASQGMPPKKREKYARREDAILHALELERQLLENKYGKLENSSNHRSKSSPDATSSEYVGNGGKIKIECRSDQIPDRLALSPVEKDAEVCLYEVIPRDESQLSGEDDGASVLPRTRGLQDFGLHTAPIREELSGVPFRAKRSRCAYLPNDSGDYLNDSRLQSSLAEMPVSKLEEKELPYSDLGEEHISGSTEDTETDCSETDSMESDSDDDLTAISDGSASIELQPKYPRIEASEGHGSIHSDDPDELTFPDDLSNPGELAPTKSGVSKWQLKRKRNNRGLGKLSLDRTDAEVFRGYTNGRSSNWTSGGIKGDSIQKSCRTHVAKYRSTSLSRSSHSIMDPDVLTWNNYSVKRGFWDDNRECTDTMFADKQHHFGGRIMLVDVDLEVQASNYRRDVPMISMLSMLNGHAIVGHPIQTEVLESGSSENLLPTAGNIFPESLESPNRLPPSWRTGRRTANSRVPRPHLYSSMENDCRPQARSVYQDRKLPFGSGQGQKANMSTSTFSNYSAERLFPKISPRKISLSSNQKIRTLSSIASEPKNCHNEMRSGGSSSSDYRVDGLIKTESVPTAVACIPVSLVFSRLHEELLGRHQ